MNAIDKTPGDTEGRQASTNPDGAAVSRIPAETGRGVEAMEAAPALERLGRRLAITLALAMAAWLGLALFADARHLAAEVRDFRVILLLPVLSLSLLNYGLRFLRWQIYLRSLKIQLPLQRSLLVFLVGFLLSVTPGKAGELGKAWLVRQLGGGPARRCVPAVLAERLTDLLGVVALVCVAALALPGGYWLTLIGGSLTLLGLMLLSWSQGVEWILRHCSRWPLIGRWTGVLGEVYARLLSLLRPGILAVAVIISMAAWGAEGVGFALVVQSFTGVAAWLRGIFDYGLSTLVGAVSLLPAGLIATEGSLAALLNVQGLEPAAAASATIIIRVATLWFAVALGMLALPWVVRNLGGKGSSSTPESGVRRRNSVA